MTRVLLVGHDASLTGAPLVLLEWGRWLRSAGHDVEFLMVRGGPLVDDYADVGPTRVIPLALLHRRAAPALRVWLQVRYRSVDLAWVNTISIGRVAAHIATFAPVVTHVHELSYVVQTYVHPDDLAGSLRTTSSWVAVSPGVEAMLKELGVPAEKITVVPGMTRLVGSGGPGGRGTAVGGSGTMDWRKGSDVFLQVARRLQAESVELVWMGGNPNDRGFKGVRHDIELMGLDNVRLLGQVKQVAPFYDSLGVFVVTSREDPFPLVMLEAAASGVPIVAFRGGGGTADFIEASGGGMVVPYLDLDAMAEAVRTLLAKPRLRQELGGNARRHVEQNHRPDEIFGRLAALVEDYS